MEFDVQPGCTGGDCPGEAAIQEMINMMAAYGLIFGLGALVLAFCWYVWAKLDSQGGQLTRSTKTMLGSLVTAGGIAIAADLYQAVWNAASAG